MLKSGWNEIKIVVILLASVGLAGAGVCIYSEELTELPAPIQLHTLRAKTHNVCKKKRLTC